MANLRIFLFAAMTICFLQGSLLQMCNRLDIEPKKITVHSVRKQDTEDIAYVTTNFPLTQLTIGIQSSIYFQAHFKRKIRENYHYCVPRIAEKEKSNDQRIHHVELRRRESREPFMQKFPLISLIAFVQAIIRATQVPTNTLYHVEPIPASTPFTRIITWGPNHLPLLLEATLTRAQLPSDQRSGVPKFITDHLVKNMGMVQKKSVMSQQGGRCAFAACRNDPEGNIPDYDEAGHLLAYSLGGGMTHLFNYVPQLARLNHHLNHENSQWFHIEEYLRSFLFQHPNGRIEWAMIVHYNEPELFGQNSNRPYGFTLRYRLYDEHGRDITLPGEGDWCFSNESEYQCLFDNNRFLDE